MRFRMFLIVAAFGVLAACGGGSDSDERSSPTVLTHRETDATNAPTTLAPTTTTLPTSAVLETDAGWRYEARVSDVAFVTEFAPPGQTSLRVTVEVTNLQPDRHAPNIGPDFETLVPQAAITGYCQREEVTDSTGAPYCPTGALVDSDTLPSGNVIPAGETVSYVLNNYDIYPEGLLSPSDVLVGYRPIGSPSALWIFLPRFTGAGSL